MSRPPASTRGFALLAVLLLVSLIGLLGATYTRHVTIVSKSSSVALSTLRARSAVDSGVQYARQLLRTGRAAPAGPLDAGSADASFEMSDLGGSRSRVRVQSLDGGGLGATRLVEMQRVPRVRGRVPDDLPRLSATKALDLVNDLAVPKLHVSTSTTYTDTDLDGLIVVHDGATLTLNGCVVRGAIVSADTLTGTAYGVWDAATAPRLVVGGDLRVTPASWLPGVSIVMPDGSITGTVTRARVQVDGDVSVYSVSLAGSGALCGQLATVSAPALAAATERPGADREPRAWAASLALGDRWDTAAVATVPRVHAASDLPSITAYDFDAP